MERTDDDVPTPPPGFNLRRPRNIRKRLADEPPTEKSPGDEAEDLSTPKEEDDNVIPKASKLGHHYSADESAALRTITEPGDKLPSRLPKASVGPQFAPTNVRINCRFDYAPDLCKDYLETGFCGFGDSCKFIHDRGDYKMGWELDKEWEEQQRRVRLGRQAADEEYLIKDVEVEEKQPATSCGICGKEFVVPVVETKCGHLFCEKCALAQARKSPKCKLCDTVINGQFKIVRRR